MAKRKGFNCEKNWRGRSYKKGGERIDDLADKTELSEAEQEKLGVLRDKDDYEPGDEEHHNAAFYASMNAIVITTVVD